MSFGLGSVYEAVDDQQDHEEDKDDSNNRGNDRALLPQVEDCSCNIYGN